MIGKRFRSLPFIFANDNYTLSKDIAEKKKQRYNGKENSKDGFV